MAVTVEIDRRRLFTYLATANEPTIAFRRQAEQVKQVAQQNAPYATGLMRARHLVVQRRDPSGRFAQGWRVEVNTDYARYVHDGTRYVAARPWLRDALVQVIG